MRGSSVTGALKLTAGIALAVALLLPLHSLPAADGSRSFTYAWQMARDSWGDAALLALAFLWPVLPALLRRGARPGRGARWAGALALEPALALFSASLIVAASFAFGYVEIFPPWFMIPVAAKSGAGVTLGIAADGLYLLAWVVEVAILVVQRWTARPGMSRACC